MERQRDKFVFETVKRKYAKAYLEQINGAARRIRSLEDSIDTVRSGTIGGVDYSKDKIQTNKASDLSDVVVKINELYSTLADERIELVTRLNLIQREIAAVSNLEYRHVLIERYVKRKSWERIRTEWGETDVPCIALVTVFRKHKEALVAFYDTNEKEVLDFINS